MVKSSLLRLCIVATLMLPTLYLMPQDMVWILGVSDVVGFIVFGLCFVFCCFVLRSGTRKRAVAEVLSWSVGAVLLVLATPIMHYDIGAAEAAAEKEKNGPLGVEKYLRWMPLGICVGVLFLVLVAAPAKLDLSKKNN